MAPIDDEMLDRLLARHLGGQLDGHLGRAEPGFRRSLLAHGVAEPVSQDVAPLRLVRPDDLVEEPATLAPVFASAAAASPARLSPVASAPAIPNVFANQFANQGDAIASSQRAARRWNPRQLVRWTAAVAGTAVAASVATMMVLPRMAPSGPAGSPVPSVNNSSAVASPSQNPTGPALHYVHDRTWDEGAVLPKGSTTPMRQIHREQVEHIRWYDERVGGWVEMTVPREKTELYKLETY